MRGTVLCNIICLLATASKGEQLTEEELSQFTQLAKDIGTPA